MENNRIKMALVTSILCALVLLIGSAHSFFEYKIDGNNIQLESGDLGIRFDGGINYIDIPSAYPISDTIGKIYPYYADFTVSAVIETVNINYELQIVPSENTTIDTKYIKVYLTDQSDNPILGPISYSKLDDATYNTTGKILHVGQFKNSGINCFRVRVWIDEAYRKNVSEIFGFKIYLYAVNS